MTKLSKKIAGLTAGLMLGIALVGTNEISAYR